MTTLLNVATPALTFLLLACVGTELTREDLREVWRRPIVTIAALVGPVVLLPPAALVMIALLNPPEHVTLGLLLLAACPIGGISNAYSMLARADTALSVTLTGLSCAAATVTIPAITFVLERSHGRPLGFAVPEKVLAVQLLGVLALPVAAGMALRWRAPALAMRWGRALRAVSFVLLAALVALVLATSVADWNEARDIAAVACAFISVSFALGWCTGRAVRAGPRARFTIAAEFATRNVGVATFIAVALLGRIEFAAFAALYMVVEVPLALLAVAVFLRWQPARREEPTPAV